MASRIRLTRELEQRLAEEAERCGLSLDEYALRLLDRQLPPKFRRKELVSLIQSWIDDDDGLKEQKETGDYLIRVLDQDRLSNRKLFPPKLKGVTW